MKKTSPQFIFVFLFAAFIFNSPEANAQFTKKKYTKYKKKKSYSGFKSSGIGMEFYADDWVLYAQNTLSSPGSALLKNSYGINAEYFFADNWSLRGGITLKDNYGRITPAPVSILFFKLLAKDADGIIMSNLNNPLKTLAAAIVMLGVNDGISYNFPVGNKFHIAPYFGTCQYQFKPTEWYTCSMGVNFKYHPGKRFLVELGTEYNRTLWFKDSREALRVNFSVGIKLN
ncbi:MAG: hypothetical protein IAF38_01985 [Bacteroidia bacterium]|nr:hypothetical protein [Bacteroidia bacterium]